MNIFLLAYKRLEMEEKDKKIKNLDSKTQAEIDLLMLDRAIIIRDYIIERRQKQILINKRWKKSVKNKKVRI